MAESFRQFQFVNRDGAKPVSRSTFDAAIKQIVAKLNQLERRPDLRKREF
jgi:hypothetical protein